MSIDIRMTSPRQIMILCTHCTRENNYEYESTDFFDHRSFEALYNKGLCNFINGQDSVSGVRINLTALGLEVKAEKEKPMRVNCWGAFK